MRAERNTRTTRRTRRHPAKRARLVTLFRQPRRVGRLHGHPGGQGICGNQRRSRLHFFVVVVGPDIDVRLLDELDDGYGPVFRSRVGRRIDEHVVGDGDHLVRWQLSSVSRR